MTVDGSTAKLAADAQLPRRLVDSVAGQLARLTAPARDAAEMASVLGHSFSLDEYHLSNVFTKLGISSRSQLDGVLPAGPDPDGPR